MHQLPANSIPRFYLDTLTFYTILSVSARVESGLSLHIGRADVIIGKKNKEYIHANCDGKAYKI